MLYFCAKLYTDFKCTLLHHFPLPFPPRQVKTIEPPVWRFLLRACAWVWIYTNYWKHTAFFFTSGARTASVGLSTGFHRTPQTCNSLKSCCCNKSCCLTMDACRALCTWVSACWRQQEQDQNGSLMRRLSRLQLSANSTFGTQESPKAETNNRPSRHDCKGKMVIPVWKQNQIRHQWCGLYANIQVIARR